MSESNDPAFHKSSCAEQAVFFPLMLGVGLIPLVPDLIALGGVVNHQVTHPDQPPIIQPAEMLLITAVDLTRVSLLACAFPLDSSSDIFLLGAYAIVGTGLWLNSLRRIVNQDIKNNEI